MTGQQATGSRHAVSAPEAQEKRHPVFAGVDVAGDEPVESAVEVATVDLGRGHLVDVWAEPGAAHFFGELSGCDHDTREPWRMGFWLPRAAVEELAVPA